MKKVLTVFTLLIFWGGLLSTGSVTYAADKLSKDGDVTEAGDKQTSVKVDDKVRPKKGKKSVYNGYATLAKMQKEGKFRNGNQFDLRLYTEEREIFGAGEEGKPNLDEEGKVIGYSISESMIRAELNSMIAMGTLDYKDGIYTVVVPVSETEYREIHKRLGQAVAPLRRRYDGQVIGLNAWSLEASHLGEEYMAQARQIFGEVLLTGRRIQALSQDSPLNGLAYENVVAVTDRQVLDSKVSQETVADLGANRKLVIATSTKITYTDKGVLTGESLNYINKVLAALPLVDAKSLFDQQVIVFSLVEEDILAQIENIPLGAPRTLNNLMPSTAIRLV